MFDNYARRLGETLDALQSSIGIRNIVVRERFPLELDGSAYAGLGRFALHVKCGALVGIFAVSHILLFEELTVKCSRVG